MMTSFSTTALFIQALNVTNAAMEANRQSLILKPMLTACTRKLAGEDFAVAIYDDDPEHPVDFFTIRLRESVFVLVTHSSRPAGDVDWSVSVEYLHELLDDPWRYIDNPVLLDFDWLTQRLELVA